MASAAQSRATAAALARAFVLQPAQAAALEHIVTLVRQGACAAGAATGEASGRLQVHSGVRLSGWSCTVGTSRCWGLKATPSCAPHTCVPGQCYMLGSTNLWLSDCCGLQVSRSTEHPPAFSSSAAEPRPARPASALHAYHLWAGLLLLSPQRCPGVRCSHLPDHMPGLPVGCGCCCCPQPGGLPVRLQQPCYCGSAGGRQRGACGHRLEPLSCASSNQLPPSHCPAHLLDWQAQGPFLAPLPRRHLLIWGPIWRLSFWRTLLW